MDLRRNLGFGSCKVRAMGRRWSTQRFRRQSPLVPGLQGQQIWELWTDFFFFFFFFAENFHLGLWEELRLVSGLTEK